MFLRAEDKLAQSSLLPHIFATFLFVLIFTYFIGLNMDIRNARLFVTLVINFGWF